MLCEAGITRSGQFSYNTCFPRNLELEEEFIGEIHRVSRRARINPAVREGKTSAVMLYYRVAFAKQASETEIKIYPNTGIDRSQFGDSYFAPQWVSRRGADFPCSRSRGRQLSLHSFTLNINAQGNSVGGLTFENDDISSEREIARCERDANRFSDREWFIPGVLNGEYVEATFHNIYWNDALSKELAIPRDRSSNGVDFREYCINRPLAC